MGQGLNPAFGHLLAGRLWLGLFSDLNSVFSSVKWGIRIKLTSAVVVGTDSLLVSASYCYHVFAAQKEGVRGLSDSSNGCIWEQVKGGQPS